MGLHFQVIGYPVQYSLSPWIHGEFLKKADLNGTYTKNEIEPNKLNEKFEQIKAEQIDGFNVTKPHKQAIIPLLDELDETAEKMGAVNTVVSKNGKWIGYNTDGIGYTRSLENKYPELFSHKDKNVLILGAGGAARAIFHALDRQNFTNIDIANRTKETAKEITKLKSKQTNIDVLTLREAEKRISNYDLVIQTTSVGMKPDINQSIIELDKVKNSTIVSDIIYQPIKTKLLQQAEEAGAKIHFGHTMLIYQAQAAFEIWTGKRVEIGEMDTQLQQILEGR